MQVRGYVQIINLQLLIFTTHIRIELNCIAQTFFMPQHLGVNFFYDATLYASAVHAVVVCPCVYVCLSVSRVAMATN